MLHANICESRKLSGVSVGAETLYYRLLTRSDDNGNFYADPVIVRGQCLPLRKGISIEKVSDWIKELASVQSVDEENKGLIGMYSRAGEKYLHISRFHEFQTFRVDVKSDIRYPIHPSELGPQNVNGKWQSATGTDTARIRNGYATGPEQLVEDDDTSSPTTRSGSINTLSSSFSTSKREEKKEEQKPGKVLPENVAKDLGVIYKKRWHRKMKLFPKDLASLATLLRNWDSTTIEKAYREYLKEGSSFLSENRHPFGLFAKQFESYVVEEDESEKQLQPPDAGPMVEYEGKMIPAWLREDKVRDKEIMDEKQRKREEKEKEEARLAELAESTPL